MKVLMVAAEATPFVKVGGLADVAGSLPEALNKLGADTRLILPLHQDVDRKKFELAIIKSGVKININSSEEKINIYKSKKSAVPAYFIESKKYFSNYKVYEDKTGEKFIFFSQAVLQAIPFLGFTPEIIHCNDAHTALIPAIIKYSGHKYKTIFTIHNLLHQLGLDAKKLKTININNTAITSLNRDAQDGDINLMVQGLLNADIVNTVSPSYAKEIATKEYGEGLDRIIKSRRKPIYGILNGIDTKFFNPEDDKLIKANFSKNNLESKNKNKQDLLKKLKLETTDGLPICSLISRLVPQKGIELIISYLKKYKNNFNAQFIFLGAGDKEYEEILLKLAKKYPKYIAVKIGFDEKLAHQIYAGTDIFLMPSLFEPCGLGQMIAMRYGTIPLVRKVGGLKDSVDSRVGFSFKNFSNKEFDETLIKALTKFKNKKAWTKMQFEAMNRDFSWNQSAKEYLKLYKKLC